MVVELFEGEGVALVEVGEGLELGFLVEGHVRMLAFGSAACFFVGAQLHLSKCFMAELEKFLRLARSVPS